MSGTEGGPSEMLGRSERWRERQRMENGCLGGCQLMAGTDILYESIVLSRGFPLCLSAQLVQPSDNKTTSSESWCGTFTRFSGSCTRVTGLLWTGKRLRADRHAGSTGHREHAPAWRPLLLPWHSDTVGWRGEETMQMSWAVRAHVPRLRQRTENQFFTFPCLILPSRLSARQAERLSSWVSIAYTYTDTHTYTCTHWWVCALCVLLFVMSSLLCYSVCRHTWWWRWLSHLWMWGTLIIYTYML